MIMRTQNLISIFLLTAFTFNQVSLQIDALPIDKPSVRVLANCGKLTAFYISQEGWRVSTFSSCFRTPYGGNYIFYSAVKNNHSLIWASEGGNGVRDYTVISTNLDTQAYIQYKAGLGIRGKGFVNSLQVEELNGKDLIPVVNILSVLEWQQEFYNPSSVFRNNKCNTAIKSAHEQIELARNLEVRSYIDNAIKKRPSYLDDRPLRLRFSISGYLANDLIRADKLLSSISSSIANSCPFISMVDFGIQNSDNIATYGLFENGQTKLFQCVGVRRVEQGEASDEPPWGYYGCFFKR